jgi:uncharacterized membrane protein
MDERSVNERLARLEERLSRLEQRLGTSGAPTGASAQPQPVVPPAPPAVRPPPLPGRFREMQEAAEEAAQLREAAVPAAGAAREEPPPAPPVVRDIPVAAAAPAVPRALPYRPQPPGGTLEAQVGLKWAGWAGAIIVVIGAALAIKYAYDQDWFGALPKAARLGLMSLGGFALLGAGEIVYRRVGAVAAAALFGAGVATLFVVGYAGHVYFELYERNVAFGTLVLVTLLGAAVAIRGNLVSIAVLSIVGGNVAPLALRTGEANLPGLLAYLLAMQVVALVLAWWGRDGKWWMLRGVALTVICVWMALPVTDIEGFTGDDGVSHRWTVLAYAIVYAVLFHAELVLSALRGPRPLTKRVPAFAVPVPLGAGGGEAEQRGLGVTFGLLVTAALTFAVLFLVKLDPPLVRGAWVVGMAACCLGLGVLVRRLGDRRTAAADPMAPPSPLLALSLGYRIQAAALLVVAVPVTLSGVWITTAWAVMALALAVVGARLNLGVSRGCAVLVWMLAVAHLGLWTLGASIGGTPGTGPTATWAVVFGQPLPAYLVLAALMAVVGHAVAALVREDWSPASAAARVLDPAGEERAPLVPVVVSDDQGAAPLGDETAGKPAGFTEAHSLEYARPPADSSRPFAGMAYQSLASVADVLAILAFAIAAFAALPPLGITLASLCYGWALIAAGYVVRSPELHPAGLLLLLAAAMKWLLFDTLAARVTLGQSAPAYEPVYNPLAALGAALFVSGIALLRVPLHLPRRLYGRMRRVVVVSGNDGRLASIRSAAGFLAVLVLIWAATLEIDRYFEARALASGRTGAEAAAFARNKQVAISVVWSLYAVACVAAGFALRAAGLRYFGLALFALTVVKVMLVDLGSVQAGYRILSFLGLGLLLLGTSVLYGKLSPILLGESERSETARDPSADDAARV